MPKRPPQRPTRTDTIGATSLSDPTSDRALAELRELVARMQQLMSAPTATRYTLNAIIPLTNIAGSIYANPTDGELYWLDYEGNRIQLTDDGAVNAPSGGGDTYGSRSVSRCADIMVAGTGSPINFTNGRGVGSTGGSCNFYVACPDLRVGDRILSVTCRFDIGVTPGTTQFTLRRRDNPTVSLGVATSTSAAGGDLDLTLTLGSPESISAGRSYVLFVELGRSQDSLETITVEYDRP